MAVTLGATESQRNDNNFVAQPHVECDITHTVDSGTTLLVVSIKMKANETVTSVNWNTSETLTLVRESGSGTNNTDMRNWVYALVNPTATSSTVDIVVSSNPSVHADALNFIGTTTSATVTDNIVFLSEDINNTASTTNVHASAGTAGNALYLSVGYQGGGSDPCSNATGFTENFDGAVGTNTTRDITYYTATLLDGAPAAITCTGSASNENTGQYFEIVAASADITIPVPVGALTATGYVPVAIQTFSIPVPLGTATFTGFIPLADTADTHIRGPPLGTGTFTGFIPTLVNTSDASGAVITNSLTAYSVGSDQAWNGKTHKAVWWNAYQGRWDGAIPYNEAGALSADGDTYVCKDITSPTWPSVGVLELEDRSLGQTTIYWDNPGKLLHVVSSHETGSWEYWRLAYNDGTDAYSFEVGSAGAGETVTNMPVTPRGMTIGMTVTPNGDVWVACQTDAAGLNVQSRTTVWAANPVVLDANIDNGPVTVNYFTDAGGDDNVFVFSSENDVTANAEWNAYFIDSDGGDGSWETDTNWTEDSWTKTDMDSQESDNHLDSVRFDNTILIVTKTGATTAPNVNIGLWERAQDGTYTAHHVEDYTATSSLRRTRPVIAIDENDLVYIAFNHEPGSVSLGHYRTSDASDLDTWVSEQTLFENGDDYFHDIHSPQGDFVCTSTSSVMFVADHSTDPNTGFPGDDVWYSALALTQDPKTEPVPVGSATLAGFAPTLITSLSIDVPLGTGTFSGFAPDLIQTFSIDVPAGAGSFLGYAPDLIQTFSIDVPVGSGVFAGAAPTVERSWVIDVPAGTGTFTGYAPTLVQTFSIDVPLGTGTFTGYAPDLGGDKTIPVPVGSLTLTGEPIALPIHVVGAISSLVLTGYAPTVTITESVAVPLGSASFTGYAPTLIASVSIDIPLGAGTFTGYAPSLVQTFTIEVPAGSATFTGYAPSLVQTFTIEVPAGSATFTGLVPDLLTPTDITIEIPAGSLAITGHAPSAGGGDGKIGRLSAGLYSATGTIITLGKLGKP